MTDLRTKANEIRKHEGWIELAKASLNYTRTIRGQLRRSVTIECDEISVEFDTTTEAAKEWFYPRYYDGDIHEPALTRRLLRRLRSDSVFYDVGAHVGYFTTFGAKKCTEGNVHSFDIESKSIEAISRTLKRNNLDAEVVQAAVSDESRDALSYTGSGPRTQVTYSGGQSTIKSIKLDDYAHRHSPPDVMKIDVEGHEYNVLRGAERLLNDGYPNVLFLEVHPENLQQCGFDTQDITTLLKKHNYDWVNFNHRIDDTQIQRRSMTEISENSMYLVVHESTLGL